MRITSVRYQFALKVTQEEQSRNNIFGISCMIHSCITSMYVENDIFEDLIRNIFLTFSPSAKPQKPLTFNKHCTFGYAECNKRRPLIDGASVNVSLDRNTLFLR